MKKFFKPILLGFVSLFSLASCNNPQWSYVANWTQGGNKNNEITISTSDVTITNQSRKSVAENGVKYYFIVEATCSYPNAEIYGSFVLMNSNDRTLEELKDVKGTFLPSTYVYTFKAEIKEQTWNQFAKYSASFNGKAYSNGTENQGNLVSDEYITITNFYKGGVSSNKVRVGIKSLYNLTYLSYSISLFFNTYSGAMKIDGEVNNTIPANEEYLVDIDATNINFSYETCVAALEVKTAKTKDQIIKDKKFDDKKYTYVFLDLDNCLYDYRIVSPNISPVFGDELKQTFKNYPYLTFSGYKSEKGTTDLSFALPTATKNLIFYPTVEINYTKFRQQIMERYNAQYSSLKVQLEYYDTVLGVVKYTVAESHGSGIVFGGDRSSRNEYYYALTNYHVVDALVEKDYSGHQGIRGTVIDYDEEKFEFSVYATDKAHDLAIIRFKANKTIHLVDFDWEGEDMFKYSCVAAIGCPGSSFLKVTTGDYTGTLSIKNSYGYVQTCIAHTADGDHGSSGGPVFNWRYRLVGLTVGITSSNKIIAVSIGDIKNFVSQYNILM